MPARVWGFESPLSHQYLTLDSASRKIPKSTRVSHLSRIRPWSACYQANGPPHGWHPSSGAGDPSCGSSEREFCANAALMNVLDRLDRSTSSASTLLRTSMRTRSSATAGPGMVRPGSCLGRVKPLPGPMGGGFEWRYQSQWGFPTSWCAAQGKFRLFL